MGSSASDEGMSVDTSFDSEYTVLSGDGTEESDSIKCHRTSDRLGLPPQTEEMPSGLDNVRDLGNIPGYILKMWLSLERKLDTLLQQASQEKIKLDGGQKCKVLNVSKNGLILRIDGSVDVGQFLLVRILPPTFPPFFIDVVGEVKTSDETACKVLFKAINEDDRELLITYIFKRQREILRLKMETELN